MKYEVQRRSSVSYAEFAQNYLYANKPVIITDALRGWTALSRWTPEFFKREFGDLTFTMDDDLGERGRYGGGGGPQTYTMAQFIDRVLESSEAAPAPYFRNRVIRDLFPSLAQDIQPLPDYFLPNWLGDRYLVGGVRRVLNRGAALELYIGGQGGTFPVLHYDGAGTHAFLMQVYGRKEFVLFPPEEEAFLYPSPERQNLSLVNDINKPDLEKFPLFARATPLTFVLEPGELLFVPSHWWHTTKMLTPSISVSSNVLNQSNWHEMMAFVCMRRPLYMRPFVWAYLRIAGAWRIARDRHRSIRRRTGALPSTSRAT